MEVDNKPQPMAGFTVGTVKDHKRAQQMKRKSTNQLFRDFRDSTHSDSDKIVKLEVEDNQNVPPPLTRKLTPMSDLLESLLETERTETAEAKFPEASESVPPALTRRLTPLSDLLLSSLDTGPVEEKEDHVYFSVDVDVDKLHDWKETLREEQNNNKPGKEELAESGAVVNVNNTDIAVFKYGDSVIATSERCPHAGGPLHLGDIELLPDRSLCVRCPWHKWAFCVSSSASREDNFKRDSLNQETTQHKKVGDCIHPPSRTDKKLKVFPAVMGKNRRHIRIGFESITKATLMEEKF